MGRRIGLLLLCLLLLLIGGFGWLCGTPSGAVWLLRQVTATSDIEIQTEQLTGTLGSSLQMEGLRVGWPGGRIAIEAVRFAWHPLALLHGELAVEALVASGLVLQIDENESDQSESPEDQSPVRSIAEPWPVPDWLQARIGLLQLQDFVLDDQPEEPIVIADRIEIRHGELQHSLLQAEAIAYHSPYVRVDGVPHWQLKDMALRLSAEVSIPEDLVDPELFRKLQLPQPFMADLAVVGDWTGYRGQARVRSGQTELRSEVLGRLLGVDLRQLAATWCGGRVSGALDLDWSDGFSLQGEIEGQGLNPESTLLGRSGEIDLALEGRLRVPLEGPLHGGVTLNRLRGSLAGYPLQGSGGAAWTGQDWQFDHLGLQSQGLQLQLDGNLKRRVTTALQVTDLATWWQDGRGKVTADGWLRWDGGLPQGDFQFTGEGVGWGGLSIATLGGQMQLADEDERVELQLQGRELKIGDWQAQQLEIDLHGTADDHRLRLNLVAAEGELAAVATGQYRPSLWEGELEELQLSKSRFGDWSLAFPTPISLVGKQWQVGEIVLHNRDQGRVRLAASGESESATGKGKLAFEQLDLNLLHADFSRRNLIGKASGAAEVAFAAGRPTEIAAQLRAHAALHSDIGSRLLSEIQADLDWGSRGLAFQGRVVTAGEARAELTIRSPEPVLFALPASGEMQFALREFDLNRLSYMLPTEITLNGQLDGDGGGRWSRTEPFALQGKVVLLEGDIDIPVGDAALQTRLQQAEADWRWDETGMSGKLLLNLSDKAGNLQGELLWPLPASFPLETDPQAPLKGHLRGRLGSQFLADSLNLTMVEDLRGELQIDAALGGRPGAPDLSGSLEITEAGGYLPDLGVELQGVTLDALLEGESIQLRKLKLQMGQGELKGAGELRFDSEQGPVYRLDLEGENLTLMALPELDLIVSSQLRFQGDAEMDALTGEVSIDSFELRQNPASQTAMISPDVVVIDPEQQEGEAVRDRRLQLKLRLGDQVRVAYPEVNARLVGGLDLGLDERGGLRANGELRFAEGAYQQFGVRLAIDHGNIIFLNDPVTNPQLDILAVRTAGAVKAGVLITGRAEEPNVRLYSRPSMPDRDILLTIISGQRLGSNEPSTVERWLGGNAVLPFQALFSVLGGTEIDLQGMFTSDGGVRLRTQIGEKLELETLFGENSGFDVYYVMEFDDSFVRVK